MVPDYLLDCFPVNSVVEDDGHALGRVDLGRSRVPLGSVAELRLPVLLLVGRVLGLLPRRWLLLAWHHFA